MSFDWNFAEITKRLRHILKAAQWVAQSNLNGLLALLVLVGLGLGQVFSDHPSLRYGGFGLAAASFVVLVVRYRLEKKRGRLLAVKGLAPFEQREGTVFQGFGRSEQIEELVRHTNDPHSFITILRGVPGSGRTSLLQAGLCYKLEERKTPWAYWDARSHDVLGSFVEVVRERLHVDFGDDLSHSPTKDTPGVIIIDHFEELYSANQHHQKVFIFLQELLNQKATNQLRFVFAVRDDFDPAWLKAEVSNVILPMLPAARAGEIMTRILNEANLRVQPALVRHYIDGIARDESVLPLDIGIGTLGIMRWTERTRRLHLTVRNFLRRGGATGILNDHLQRTLEIVRPEHKQILLETLHTCLANATRGCKYEGVSVAAIHQTSGIQEQQTRNYLQHLAAPMARILEQVYGPNGDPRYCLPHGRLNIILSILGMIPEGMIAERNTAWRFLDSYYRWIRTHHPRALLNGSLLRRLKRLKSALLYSAESAQRKEFLKASRRRGHVRWISVGLILLLIVVACAVYSPVWYHMLEFSRWNLPADLYIWQQRLEALHIDRTEMTTLDWLSSRRLNELELTNVRLSNLNDITNAPNLRTLNLSLANSQVANLDPLGGLQQLDTLTLSGLSTITTLHGLARLPKLQRLTLHLGGGQLRDLTGISNLESLNELCIQHEDLRNDELRFPEFNNLRTLTLDLQGSDRLERLPSLDKIAGLDTLFLNLRGTKIQQLSLSTQRPSLHTLSVDAEDSKLTNFDNLAALNNLENLTLNLKNTRAVHLPPGPSSLRTLNVTLTQSKIKTLPKWRQFPHLEGLALTLDSSEPASIPDLGVLRDLTKLTLNLNASNIHKLPLPSQISHLNTLSLDVRGATISNLGNIVQMQSLNNLTLSATWAQLAGLPRLAELTNLQTLTLFMYEDPSTRPETLGGILTKFIEGLPVGLREVTFNLGGSSMEALPSLSRFKELHSLTLNLAQSHLRNVATLRDLEHIHRLTIDLESSPVEFIPDFTPLSNLEFLSLSVKHAKHLQYLPTFGNRGAFNTLMLDLEDSAIKAFPDLTSLNGIRRISVNLKSVQLDDDKGLGTFTPQQAELTLDHHRSLANVSPSVTRLNLDW